MQSTGLKKDKDTDKDKIGHSNLSLYFMHKDKRKRMKVSTFVDRSIPAAHSYDKRLTKSFAAFGH